MTSIPPPLEFCTTFAAEGEEGQEEEEEEEGPSPSFSRQEEEEEEGKRVWKSALLSLFPFPPSFFAAGIFLMFSPVMKRGLA